MSRLLDFLDDLAEAIPPDVKLFVKGAVAAFLGGAATAAVAYLTDPSHYALGHLDELGRLALVGGVVAVAAYFRKSPLPQWKWEKEGGVERRR